MLDDPLLTAGPQSSVSDDPPASHCAAMRHGGGLSVPSPVSLHDENQVPTLTRLAVDAVAKQLVAADATLDANIAGKPSV